MLTSIEIEALLPEWSDCMADAGYTYTTFREIPGAFIGNGGEPSEFEIEVATADAQCRDSSNISDVGDSLFAEAAETSVANQQEALDFISTELDAMQQRALDSLQ